MIVELPVSFKRENTAADRVLTMLSRAKATRMTLPLSDL